MNGSTWSALRAMIWKECRENGKWALLAGVGVAGVVLYETPRVGGRFDDYWSGVGLAFFAAARIVAILLAMLQILPELRRDRWAFLAHRPAPRGLLFAGKVVAGLTLYLLAMATPLLCAMLWAQTPGKLAAPFDWGQTWVSATQILSGAVLYFAALLTALRPGRWYGGRLAPLLAGLAAGLAAQGSVGVPIVVWSNVPVGLILLIAAWKSFTDRDETRRRGGLAQGSLAVAMYLGLTVLCVALFLTGEAAWSSFAGPKVPRYAEYKMTSHGQIVLARYRGQTLMSATPMAPKSWTNGYSNDFVTKSTLVYPWIEQPDSRDDDPRFRVETLTRIDTPGYGIVDWLYLRPSRQIVGYSERTLAPIGVLSPNGFSASDRSGAFPEDLHHTDREHVGDFVRADGEQTHLDRYVFGSHLYVIDWEHLKISQFFSTGGEKIVNASVLTPIVGKHGASFLVSTQSCFMLLSASGQTVYTAPREYPSRLYDRVELSVTDGGRYFFWYIPRSESLVSHQPIAVTEVSPAGVVLKHMTLPPISVADVGGYSDSRYAGLVVPPFASIAAAAVVHALAHSGNASAIGQRTDFTDHSATWTAFAWISAITAICCGVLAALIARRCGLRPRDRRLWAVTYAFLGLPGLLTLLALRSWPARTRCSECGKKRVVDHERCAHCGVAFASAPLDGTEIFEAPGLILHTEAA